MFALCRPKNHGSTPRGTPGNFGLKWPTPVDLRVGDIRSQIAAEWSQIAQRSQWRAYRKPPSLFLMVPSLTPYDLPFPKMGVPYAPNIREWPSATGDAIRFMFGSRVGFLGTADRTNPKWRPPSWKNFTWSYLRNRSYISATAHDLLMYSAHRAVIFAIAQLSCRTATTA